MKATKSRGRGRPAPQKEKAAATEQVHLRMTADLHEYLREEAITKGRTLSGLIIFACEEYRRTHPVGNK